MFGIIKRKKEVRRKKDIIFVFFVIDFVLKTSLKTAKTVAFIVALFTNLYHFGKD